MPRDKDRERRRERRHRERGERADRGERGDGNTNDKHRRRHNRSQTSAGGGAADSGDPTTTTTTSTPPTSTPAPSNNNNANNNDFEETTLGETTLSSYHDRELAELQLLCDAASESDPTSWEKIRRWLRNHSADDARHAAERRGDYETTPLHLACRNCPPLDIVNMLLTASPKTVELADSFGWLPLVSFICCCWILLLVFIVWVVEIYLMGGKCYGKGGISHDFSF